MTHSKKFCTATFALPLLLASSLLSSCGDEELAQTVQSVQGTWRSGCEAVGGSYQRLSNTFTVTNMTGTQTVYSDSDCTTQLYKTDSAAAIVDGGSSAVISGAVNYNFTWSSITATPLSTTGANGLNSFSAAGETGYCNKTDWANNVAQSVAGLICNGQQVPAADSTKYDVIKVTDDYLQFGDTATGAGTTSGTRPTALHTRKYYKQ